MTALKKNSLPVLFRSSVALALVLAGLLPQAIACGPSGGDPTVCTSNATTVEADTAVSQGAGNPIDLISGNKYRREVDLPALPGEVGLELSRHYNSMTDRVGLLGQGWNLSFEIDLFASARDIQIHQGDGRRIIFARGKMPTCQGANPEDGTMTEYPDRFEWRWPDGRRFVFARVSRGGFTRGRIESMTLPSGAGWDWRYGPHGELISVADRTGRALTLIYDAKGRLGRIKTPGGEYVYGRDGDGRLSEVRGPEGYARRYHYDDARFPQRLTGIDENQAGPGAALKWVGIAHYGYDSQARATLSEGAGGANRVRVEWDEAGGSAWLTNARGGRTHYRWKEVAGQPRLIEARGPACTGCSPGDVRYEWSVSGQLLARIGLDRAGEPLRRDARRYDRLGRLIELSTQSYTGGKPGKLERLRRFEYQGDSDRPVLIAEPSVVPGQEHQWRLAYDAQGMLTTVTEIGFTPDYQDKPAAKTTRVTRLARDGKGRVLAIDGPLPGAADTMRYRYGATGELVAVRAPDGRELNILARDAAGHVSRWSQGWGERAHRFAAEYDARGRLRSLQEKAGEGDAALTRTFVYRYDSADRLLAATGPDELSTRYDYDPAGNPRQIVAPDGSRVELAHDASGQVTQASRLDPHGQIRQSGRFVRDERGALAAIEDRLGRVLTVAYAPGKVELEDAAGVRTRLELDLSGRLLRRDEALGTPEAASVRIVRNRDGRAALFSDALQNVTRRLYDDFGQLVAEASPDRGQRVRYFDVAGRLIALWDESSAVSVFHYDAAGRLTTAGTPQRPSLVRYVWRDGALAQIRSSADSPHQPAREVRTRAFDAMGRLLSETLWRARLVDAEDDAERTGPLWTTRYRYDAAGRRCEEIRPDGHRIAWRYGANGQMAGIDFDGVAVLDDLEGSLFGGTDGWRFGNGIVRHVSLDARGRTVGIAEDRRQPANWLARGLLMLTPRETGEHLLARLGLWRTTSFARQSQGYDAAGHVRTLARQFDGVEQKMAMDYDARGRLVAWHDDVRGARYVLDAAGNRTEESLSEGGRRERAVYRYRPGSQQLIARLPVELTGPLTRVASRAAEDSPELRLLAYREDGVPYADFTPTHPRHFAYDGSQHPTSASEGQQVKVRYAVGLGGERLARRAGGHTSYTLYADQRLAMEADEQGRIVRHYLYLDGRPVARIDIDARGEVSRYMLHTDEQGTVLAVTDDAAQLIWAAEVEPFGRAHVRLARRVAGQPFEQDLRLPGQRLDPATGLADNYHRSYDAGTGRYLEPDPLGAWAGGPGPNPYLYVGGNPLGASDPQGLYQSDIHYYMTFFLAVAAGMSTEDAHTLALADQYVDDSPDTEAVNPSLISSANFGVDHQSRMLSYHFTPVVSHVDPITGRLDGKNYGRPTSSTAYEGPDSSQQNAQLQRLYQAVKTAGTDTCVADKRQTQLVFYGEYLHAYADTFAHRDSNNKPIGVNMGLGHARYGSDPDYTYDHWSWIGLGQPGATNWNHNAARTLQAELNIYQMLLTNKTINPNGKRLISDEELQKVLKEFNSTEEYEGKNYDPKNPSGSKKIEILQRAMRGIPSVDGVEWVNSNKYSLIYSVAVGKGNRDKFLCSGTGVFLDQTHYAGTILPSKC